MRISPRGLHFGGRWTINVAFLTSSVSFSRRVEAVEVGTIRPSARLPVPKIMSVPLASELSCRQLNKQTNPMFWTVDMVMWSTCLVCKKPGTIHQAVIPALRKWKQKVHKFKVTLRYLLSLNRSWTT